MKNFWRECPWVMARWEFWPVWLGFPGWMRRKILFGVWISDSNHENYGGLHLAIGWCLYIRRLLFLCASSFRGDVLPSLPGGGERHRQKFDRWSPRRTLG